MYNLLKDIATNNNWFFEYSRSDYQNLYDGMEIKKVHLFVDPITTHSTFNTMGTETKTYTGKFMLLVSSDIDEDYQRKYLKHIKPMLDIQYQKILDSLRCEQMIEIEQISAIDIINLFDVNLDGVLINYKIKQYPE